MEGKGALRDAVEAFANAKKWDMVNEKRPTKKQIGRASCRERVSSPV